MFSLNNIVYQQPQPSYDRNTFKGHEDLELFYVKPKTLKKHEIPCLHLKADSSEYLLYFHGNAEDLGSSFEFILKLNQALKTNVIAVEYPGYGVYGSHSPSQKQIEQDSEQVFIFMQLVMRVPDAKITIFGRSIGSGPACFLASIYQPKALILMTPFTSIREVVRGHVSFFSYLLKDQFDNIHRATKITCPCLVIHGKRDKLIPFSHAESIYKNLASQRKSFKYPEHKSHNDFSFDDDLKQPLMEFIEEIDFLNLNMFVKPLQ